MSDPRTPDDFEALLRRALREEADTVHPGGDGLARIRERTAARPVRRPWWQPVGLALVAAAVAGVLAAGTAAVLQRDDGVQEAGPGPTPTTSAEPEPTASASTSPAEPSASTTTSPSATGEPIRVPVYYVGDAAADLRLYREFHPVATADPARSAVEEMLRGEPVDPDYSSPWPQDTRLLSLTVEGDTATVDLSAFPSLGAEAERIAVQQLVYTVTAAQKDVTSVRLLVDGATPESGHSDLSEPQSRARQVDVQSQIWIIDPAQGARVGSPVDITVFGTGFEGTIYLKVFAGDASAEGAEVEATFVTTEQGVYREGSTSINLAPGDYTLRAYNEFGEEQALRELDSKAFTVE